MIYLTHAQNAYLNVLVEQGWLGLAGYVGLLAGAAWVGLRRVINGQAAEPALAIAGLLFLIWLAVLAVAARISDDVADSFWRIRHRFGRRKETPQGAEDARR